MTPHERRVYYEQRAVESQYEHDEMREIYADWAEDLKQLTDAELFAERVDLQRIGRFLLSMESYAQIEQVRRAE